jgi:membrane protease YdiL (CAAX protease family)
MKAGSLPEDGADRRLLVVTAWASMLLVSDLPDILWKSVSGQISGWLHWGKVAILGVFLGLCVIWKKIRPLKSFAFVMLVFFVALGVSGRIAATSWWRGRFNTEGMTFFTGYLGAFLRDAGVALVVVALLFIAKRRRDEFFLVKGRLDAPIEPVRWLGIKRGETWRTFGWIFALVAGAGVFIPTFLSIRPSAGMLSRAVPLLPSVLFFAAVNALTEEIYFRASLLSTLHEVIGKTHTLLIASVFFGLAHWLYGSPPGIPGFLMTGFLAWILGKSMLETKGLLWPWFIHFIPDVVVFASYAVLWAGP